MNGGYGVMASTRVCGTLRTGSNPVSHPNIVNGAELRVI